MNKKISEIFVSTMFECNGYACHCMKDIENIIPGEEPVTRLKLYADQSKPLHFAYTPKEGLNLTGPAGGIIDQNILGRLLSLPADDIDKHIEFFEKYGFLLPLDFDEFSSIEGATVLAVVNHIKATIRLMNAIGKRDYRRMLIHASYLLFTQPVTYQTSSQVYTTCQHQLTYLLASGCIFPDVNQNREIQATGALSINDSILGRKNRVSIEFINAIRSGVGTEILGSKSTWFKSITALYLTQIEQDEELKRTIDFFYHLFTEIGVFDEVEFTRIKPYGTLNLDLLSDAMKDSLLKIARYVISEEINYNISGIHPKYDGGKLTATWQVDTLLEAIYFSIFYMKAGVEIYKECENPNCKRDKYFLVEATRTNKKYCCSQCANAAAAQRHRNRQL